MDPDGTKEFINKTGEFTINLALVRDHQVIAGFIFVPSSDSFYYAIKGQGSFGMNGKSERIKLQVPLLTFKTEGIRVLASRQGMDHHSKKYIESFEITDYLFYGKRTKVYCFGQGRSRLLSTYDPHHGMGYCRRQIIIEEAGGKLIDAHTNLPLVYNKTLLTNPYFIAMGNAIDEKRSDITAVIVVKDGARTISGCIQALQNVLQHIICGNR